MPNFFTNIQKNIIKKNTYSTIGKSYLFTIIADNLSYKTVKRLATIIEEVVHNLAKGRK